MNEVVLSLFPGIGILDMGFEEAGFCVVRGPDLLWGGDIKQFHPPAGKFDGVIGGPPCQAHSSLAAINLAQGRRLAEDLIPEFARVVMEAEPAWWLMENVPRAPGPAVDGYHIQTLLLNNRSFGGVQNRKRKFVFGARRDTVLLPRPVALEATEWEPAVTSTSGGRRAMAVRDKNGRVCGKQGDADSYRLRGRSIERMAELQGLPPGFAGRLPFTAEAKRTVIANGVPLPMARALALAVREAIDA